MALFSLWCLILLASALPGLAPHVLSIDANPPDLWVAVVVYLALRGRGHAAIPWAVLLGIVQDSLSLDPIGTHAFVLGFVAWLFCEGRGPRPRLEGGHRAFVTLLATVVAGWVYLVRILPFGGGAVAAIDFVHVLPTAIWTTLFSIGLYPLLDHYGLLDDLCGRAHGLPA